MSSIDKSIIKMAAAYEIGVRLDDILESAEKAELRTSGVPDWMRRVEAAVMLLQADIDMECGEMLEQASALKEIVARAQAKIVAITLQAENENKVAAGRVVGLKMAVEVAKRLHEEEKAKMIRVQQIEAEAISAGRDPDARPASIKMQRLAESGQQVPVAQQVGSKISKSSKSKPKKRGNRAHNA